MKKNNSLETDFETLAHEIGHNLNMKHDFEVDPVTGVTKPRYDRSGNTCRLIGGVMDYAVRKKNFG
jgi:hypothetical protein